jgi:hypothetical protein
VGSLILRLNHRNRRYYRDGRDNRDRWDETSLICEWNKLKCTKFR